MKLKQFIKETVKIQKQLEEFYAKLFDFYDEHGVVHISEVENLIETIFILNRQLILLYNGEV